MHHVDGDKAATTAGQLVHKLICNPRILQEGAGLGINGVKCKGSEIVFSFYVRQVVSFFLMERHLMSKGAGKPSLLQWDTTFGISHDTMWWSVPSGEPRVLSRQDLIHKTLLQVITNMWLSANVRECSNSSKTALLPLRVYSSACCTNLVDFGSSVHLQVNKRPLRFITHVLLLKHADQKLNLLILTSQLRQFDKLPAIQYKFAVDKLVSSKGEIRTGKSLRTWKCSCIISQPTYYYYYILLLCRSYTPHFFISCLKYSRILLCFKKRLTVGWAHLAPTSRCRPHKGWTLEFYLESLSTRRITPLS